MLSDSEYLNALAKLIEADQIMTVDPSGISERLRLIARKLETRPEWRAPDQWGIKQP